MDNQADVPWFLKSNKPVLFPRHEALTVSRDEFDHYVANTLHGLAAKPVAHDTAKDAEPVASSPFIDGLHEHRERQLAAQIGDDPYNKMLTANSDVAYKSSNDRLVDLFYELEDSITGDRLSVILNEAWEADSLTSLKIIFNARSIHLGKSSRKTFYRAAGWLAKNHPHTLVANLQWLHRPVIEKKVTKAKDKDADEDDIVLVDAEADENDPSRHDVQHGVSHGYWKDLLNMLAIAANGMFDGQHDPSEVLNVDNISIRTNAMRRRERKSGGGRVVKITNGMKRLTFKPTTNDPAAEAVTSRKQCRQARHAAAIAAFENDPVYQTLHLAIARLFAEQLQKDISALRSDDAKVKRTISLCAKWAPSDDLFHDRHTFIVSSIAEILHPRSSLDNKDISGAMLQPTDDRGTYLRYAREMYRRDVSQLRKHLQIVERNITSRTYDKIQYQKVPSLAMNNYKDLFARYDKERFVAYLKDVALGKSTISGATLLPSTLIRDMRKRCPRMPFSSRNTAEIASTAELDAIHKEVLNSQWKTLVQRIKDSGTMSSAIAVCDVSGSMFNAISSDGTEAIDASIGLSLLVAEVTAPPFGGSMITFDETPEVFQVNLNQTLAKKYKHIAEAPWGGCTDFVAVFEKLLLPMAIQNNLRQEDMVKRVFVFSDMQFNGADSGGDSRWTTSYERIKAAFNDAGYEMPELVFWNLCGKRGNADFGPQNGGTDASAKPVTAADVGTMLVSGYSQAMLKAFMDGESPVEDDVDEDTEDGDAVVVGSRKKQMDSIALVKKATGHHAYSMLQVYD